MREPLRPPHRPNPCIERDIPAFKVQWLNTPHHSRTIPPRAIANGQLSAYVQVFEMPPVLTQLLPEIASWVSCCTTNIF